MRAISAVKYGHGRRCFDLLGERVGCTVPPVWRADSRVYRVTDAIGCAHGGLVDVGSVGLADDEQVDVVGWRTRCAVVTMDG
jgi:hypothetical protein